MGQRPVAGLAAQNMETHFDKNKTYTPDELVTVIQFGKYDLKEEKNIYKAILQLGANLPLAERIRQIDIVMQSPKARTALMENRIGEDLVKKLTALYSELNATTPTPQTELHRLLLQVAPMTIQQRLSFTLEQPISSENIRHDLFREVTARVMFKDLGQILAYALPLQQTFGKDAFEFLRNDFGLPIFSFTQREQAIFLQLHSTLDEDQLYAYYAEKLGIRLFGENGQPDLDNIYRILKYDHVQPFVAQYQTSRDWGVYAAIKVLERHFNTTLGFPEKINENQTFYEHSTESRANSWIEFLKFTEGSKMTTLDLPPSFSD
jgi:hypothetical protein